MGGKRYKIKLIQYDDKCSAKDAVSVGERLINNDKVPVIIGAVCSHATLALMEIAEKAKVPIVNVLSASMAVTSKGYKYIFRTGPQSAMQTEAITRYAMNDLKMKKASYIGRNDSWCQSSAAQFKKRVEARGGQVASNDFFELGTTDFNSILMKAKMANSDFLYICALSEDGAMIVKQAKELGIKSVLMGTDDMTNPHTYQIAGAGINGMYAYYGGGPSKPEAVAYEQAYEKKYNKKSVAIDKAGYDVVMLIADAITRMGKADAASITKGLRDTKLYKGIRTTYSFMPSGQAKSEMWIVQVVNNDTKFVKPIPVFDNPPIPVDKE